MDALANIQLGGITPIPNMRVPRQGAQALPVELYFESSTILEGNLQSAFESGVFDFCQSVFIDNKDNTAAFELTAPGLGNRGRVIRAQPYTQGWYPFTTPVGDGRFKAVSTQGLRIPLIFANIPQAYSTWGPADGATQVPPLTNRALDAVALAAPPGEVQLVAGLLGESVSLYRGSFSVDSPVVLKWLDGSGGTVLFTAQLTAGGSMFFSGSGVPWFTTTPGNGLFLHFGAAATLYGGFGVTQV